MNLKRFFFLLFSLVSSFLASPYILPAQEGDTVWFAEKEPKVPTHFVFYNIGMGYSDGNVQFFDGYNHEIMYTNAQAGLPLYNDWIVYSGYGMIPRYSSFALTAGMADTVKNLRLSFGVGSFFKEDSLFYTGGYAVQDTIYGRSGSETARYYSAHFGGYKTTRRLAKVFRLYTGAELEFAFSPTANIRFFEFQYDYGDDKIIQENRFDARGKARANIYGSAIVGLETIFWNRVGFYTEVRSGIGVHWVPKQGTFGLSRIAYQAGIRFYFLNY